MFYQLILAFPAPILFPPLVPEQVVFAIEQYPEPPPPYYPLPPPPATTKTDDLFDESEDKTPDFVAI